MGKATWRYQLDMLGRGLYESLITHALEKELSSLDDNLVLNRGNLRPAEAGDRLALHLYGLIASAVSSVDDKQRVERGLDLAGQLVKKLAEFVDDKSFNDEAPVLDSSVLHAMLFRNPDGTPEEIVAPLIPLLDTTLLTNAPGEPTVGSQLEAEIHSADRIDLIMAFIRRSGIRPFTKAFKRHCEAGRSFRVLTTTYTNSTEQAALEELVDMGADVRVSYDISGTRLHAKAWLFRRPGGMSTAYIGSSNLTHQAQRTGLEWNVRVSSARNAPVVEKMSAVFESYWQSGDFESFDKDIFAQRTEQKSCGPLILLAPIEIRLYPYQQRMMEQIEVARAGDQHANLLVSATGTGKTVMAAVDYARLRDRLPRARLLFVAHSKEILQQSLATYAHAIRDAEFGELWVDEQKPKEWQHVFASIQSISSSGLTHLGQDHFDVVVIDEIHHGAAESYKKLLGYIRPKELLGLTATPERADGQDILGWFGGRIAAELRLWDAIDDHRLVPFDYYGLHDGSDLTGVTWKRGKGYDINELTNIYTADEAWARRIIAQLKRRVDDVLKMKALGFCVSVDHARFMARVFQKHHIPAKAIWGDTPKDERKAALKELSRGTVNIIFSVDLFNEGIDIPNVETLLLLRPTESPVLFLQQLGRGLRKAESKVSCTVLDFIGQHRKEFKFHPRLQAFFGGSRRHVEKQVQNNFPFLPSGCHMELEPKAREIVLQSIKNAIPSHWQAKAEELKAFAEEGVVSFGDYLNKSGLELEDVYMSGNDRGWSSLKELAGLAVLPAGPEERVLRRACGRMLHVNDRFRLDAYRSLLSQSSTPVFDDLTSRGARIARMLVASVCEQVLAKNDGLADGLTLLWQHPQVRAELIELFDVLAGRIDHIHFPLISHPDVPLQIHGKYTRVEMLAAFDPRPIAKTQSWREGVSWLSQIRTDLMVFTLDKTIGQFSPTTRYRDFAISPERIHWESQSMVRADSPTGLRYRNQLTAGSHVMLFARENSEDRAFWFLGSADFVDYQGEKPMAITWKLHYTLPGDLFTAFAAAVA